MAGQRRSCITGVGGYVPEQVVTNHDLTAFMETSHEWIVQRSGIEERRWVVAGQNNTDLAEQASRRAMEQAGVQSKDIGMVVFATLNPDYCFPGNGVLLQERLGLDTIAVFDIRQQCSGFLYALSMADLYVRSGTVDHVLVVGSEIHSRGLDKSTRGRDVTVLFGDGAGAVVVSATEVSDPATQSHVYSTHLHADGSGAKNLWLPAPGVALHSEDRINQQMLDEGLHYPKMDGKKVFVEAVTRMSQVLMEALGANRMSIDSVDCFLFHQANLRINDAVASQCGIPAEKVFNTIQKFGNTTAATIPLGMYEAVRAGKLKKGMQVGMAAFGSGYTWGAALLRY